MAKSTEPVTIKKYANRRLYNTGTSTYVTLEDLASMVKKGEDFLVYDAKTGEDLTRSILTQIILEEDGKGRNLLPINFLRQVISFYDDSLRAFLPRYLELSMENFASNQEQIRRYIEGTLAEDGDPLDALVLVGEPTFPGCRIRGRVVGVFNMTDEKGSDEKIILVPLRDPTWMRVHDVHDIQPEFRDEIEHFFQVYKDLEDAKTETRGFGNRAEAERVIEEARLRRGEAEHR